MKYLTKTLLLTLFASVIVGCGYSGDARDVVVTPETSVTITGTASKGIVKSGVVNIFGYSNGIRNTTSACNTTTSAAGAYFCIVKGYVGPVAVEITASASTKMICDVSDGCGSGVAFGADYSLGSSFTLSSVVPEIVDGEDSIANVTPLTDLAAADTDLIIAALTTSSVSAAQVTAAIIEAKKKVSVLFFDDASVDITELPVVDITDEEAVALIDDQTVLQAAMIGSAIVGSALESGGDITVEAALKAVLDEYVANDGAFFGDSATDSVIDLASIMASADEALTTVEENILAAVAAGDIEEAGAIVAIVAAVQSAITDLQETAEETGGSLVEVVVPDEPTSNYAAAREMVDDVRNVFVALGDEDFLEEQTGGETIEDYFDIAEAVAGGKFDSVLDALDAAAMTVALSSDSVNQTVGDVTVVLTAAGTKASGSTTGMTLSGVSLTSEGMTASGASGGTLVFTGLSSSGGKLIRYSDLPLTITNGVNKFTGTITYNLTTFTTTAYKTRTVRFDGEFTNGTNSFTSTIDLTSVRSNFIGFADESVSNFLDYSISARIDAVLVGITDEATILLTGDRASFDSTDVIMQIKYGSGESITVETNDIDAGDLTTSAGYSVTIAHSNGATFTGSQNDSGATTGSITVDGTVEATVTEESSGMHTVTYSNPTTGQPNTESFE